MKKHRISEFLALLLISLSIFSCKFSYKEKSGILTNPEKNSALQISKIALRFIQENEIDSLKGLFNAKGLRMAKPEQFDWLMHEGQIILNNYVYPNDTNILKSQSTNYTIGGKEVIEMFSFPFQNKTYKDSLKYFHITVIDNEIHRLFLNAYPPGVRIIEPKRNEPHRSNFNMQTENIKWFRIWYEGGIENKDRKYGNNYGYYAVSGNKAKLKKIGIQEQFQGIFNLLNNTNFDSLDFKYLSEDEQGDPELIYIRIRFANEEYINLREFTISCILKEEEGIKEINSDYIVFKHTYKTRYLLHKDKNTELVQLLTKIAHHDYGNKYKLAP